MRSVGFLITDVDSCGYGMVRRRWCGPESPIALQWRFDVRPDGTFEPQALEAGDEVVFYFNQRG